MGNSIGIKTILGVNDTVPWVLIGQNIEGLKNLNEAKGNSNHKGTKIKSSGSASSGSASGSSSKNETKKNIDMILHGNDQDINVWNIIPDQYTDASGRTINILNFMNTSKNNTNPNVQTRFQMTPDGNFTSGCGSQPGTAGYTQQLDMNTLANGKTSIGCQTNQGWTQCTTTAAAGSQGACTTGNQTCVLGRCINSNPNGFAGNYVQVGSWTIFPENISQNPFDPPSAKTNTQDGQVGQTSQVANCLTFATNLGMRGRFRMFDVGTMSSYCSPDSATGSTTNQGLVVIYDPNTNLNPSSPIYGTSCPAPRPAQCSNNDSCSSNGLGNACIGGNCFQMPTQMRSVSTLTIGTWILSEAPNSNGATTELRFTSPDGNYWSMQDSGNFLSVCASGNIRGSLQWNSGPFPGTFISGNSFSC